MVPKAIGEGINIIYIETLDAGREITLTAKADTGSVFDGWSGAGCSSAGDCVVTMDAHKSVTATFTQAQLETNIYVPFIPKVSAP